MAKLKTFRDRLASNTLPEPASFANAEECVAAYESGFEGAVYDPDSAEEVEASEFGKGENVVRSFGLEESGKGKLSLLYPAAWKVAGRNDFLHGDKSQPCGDCVSRSQTHAAIVSLAVAVMNGNGSWPNVPDDVYKYGMVFHPSPVYWFRAHGGDGWSCSAAIARSKDSVGLVLCDKYPAPLNKDLTVYNTSVAHSWGRSPPPKEIVDQLNHHCTLSYSRLSGMEQIRDMIASGYGLTTCGGEGWSSSRDANGVSKRKGSWSHALCYMGFDDTEWAHKNYGEPLVLILNSWGRSWIKGSRKVHGGDEYPEIPAGAFWTRFSECARRDVYAVSSVSGFPQQKLPDWNLRDLI